MTLKLDLTEAERIWLNALYSRQKTGERVNIRSLRIELKDKLPKDFLFSQINPLYASGDQVTLIGIMAIDPKNKIIIDMERLIKNVGEFLFEHPEARVRQL